MTVLPDTAAHAPPLRTRRSLARAALRLLALWAPLVGVAVVGWWNGQLGDEYTVELAGPGLTWFTRAVVALAAVHAALAAFEFQRPDRPTVPALRGASGKLLVAIIVVDVVIVAFYALLTAFNASLGA